MTAKSSIESSPVEPASSCGFDLETISELSNEEIKRLMTTEELIAVIRSVDYPFAGKERLEFFDRDTLERVVCLVRRWSCHRLGKPSL